MSGTSLDGIDVAIISYKHNSKFDLIAAQTFDFPLFLKEGLKKLIDNSQCDLREFGQLDIALGESISSAVNSLLADHNLNKNQIQAIGSHGQTVFHKPEGPYPFSLQIGNPNVIAELTGIKTVADFRQRDMVLSGQGAPLVPAFHKALFQDPTQNRVIINIGGISNITVLPADNNNPVIGFDTGPGNVLLDSWCEKVQQQTYDDNGQWASTGTVNTGLHAHLYNDDYFKQAIPKSTGREHFNLNWLINKLAEFQTHVEPEDVQATLSALTAHSIAQDILQYAPDTSTVYVCGGGAHNAHLLTMLEDSLVNIDVMTTEQLGLHPDWVEACAFAWLANQTVSNKSANLPDVTGAQRATILGGIYSSNDAS